MPTYVNTDAYARVYPWLHNADGTTLVLQPGETVDLEEPIPADDPWLKPTSAPTAKKADTLADAKSAAPKE